MAARAWPAEAFVAAASTSDVLKELHDSINAIGGCASNEREHGMNEAVDRALRFIEAKQAELA